MIILIRVGALLGFSAFVVYLTTISMMAAMIIGGLAFIGALVWLVVH
jgi:hypothetical protein